MTDTRDKYPDATLPGWLRDIRDTGTADTARSALLHGAELRTREIARERLDALEPSPTRFGCVLALDTALRNAIRNGMTEQFVRQIVDVVIQEEQQ